MELSVDVGAPTRTWLGDAGYGAYGADDSRDSAHLGRLHVQAQQAGSLAVHSGRLLALPFGHWEHVSKRRQPWLASIPYSPVSRALRRALFAPVFERVWDSLGAMKTLGFSIAAILCLAFGSTASAQDVCSAECKACSVGCSAAAARCRDRIRRLASARLPSTRPQVTVGKERQNPPACPITRSIRAVSVDRPAKNR